MHLRGQVSLEQIAAITGARSSRRALAEAEYLLVEGLHKLDTPEAKRAWLDLVASRTDTRRWLATVIKRKIISKPWAIMACEAEGEAWPAALWEPGGYGLDELRPSEDAGHGDYVEPLIVYALGGKLDHAVRLTGPFSERGDAPTSVIHEDWIGYPAEVEDYIDDGLISYADLKTIAKEDGFDSVDEWIKDSLAETRPIAHRAGFAASIWFDIIHYSGAPGDSEGYSWPEIERRYALEIAWENAGWLR
jgi:hypothetical protein